MAERKPQKGSRTIFIACEGTVSEKEYFEAIGAEIVENDVWVTVYPEDKESANDSLSLVRAAREKAQAFTEVWAVFDKNGHNPIPALTEAAKVINGKIVNIAYSNIAFEHWVLLHFEKNSFSFIKSDCKKKEKKRTDEYAECGKPGNTHPDNCKGTKCVGGWIRLNNYIANYSKTGGFDLYGILVTRERAAMENAAWLRLEKGTVVDAASNYDTNPYTNLDRLLGSLRASQEVINWGKTGTILTNANVNILVSDDLKVSISTNSNTSFLFNNLTLNSQFFLSNENGETFKLAYKSYTIQDSSGHAKTENDAVVIYEHDLLEIEFDLPTVEYPLYFNFRYKGTRNIFTLKEPEGAVTAEQQPE